MTGAPFSVVGPRLYDQGYAVLAVYPRGKKPIGDDWPRYGHRQTEDDVDRLARTYPNASVGIVTRNTPGVDIDVRVAEVAFKIRDLALQTLGPAPERIGFAPKRLLLYRTDAPFKKIRSAEFSFPDDEPGSKPHAVEILCDGQQVVGFGVHQDTGVDYLWPDESPLDIAAQDLTPLTEAQGRLFIASCEWIMRQHGGKPKPGLRRTGSNYKPKPKESLLARNPEELRDALAAIRNTDLAYDDWVYVGLAIKGALGEDGRALWLDWCDQSAKNDPGVSERTWDGLKPSSIGAGTIYHLAEQAGWIRPAPGDRLPVYYPGPTEPRELALERQKGVVAAFVAGEAGMVAMRKEASNRAAAEIEVAGLNDERDDIEPKKRSARKAAISRRVRKAVAREHGLDKIPRIGSRMLVTGSQGSGKSRVTAESIAALRVELVAWWVVPTIEKAVEQALEYRRFAGSDSLPVMVVRGRGADDPNHPRRSKVKMCPRHVVVNRAAAMQINVRKKICSVCPLRDSCGTNRQQAEIDSMGGQGVFLMSRDYLTLPCPAPSPDLLIGDETVLPVFSGHISFHPDRIVETGNWQAVGLDAALEVRPILNATATAVRDNPGRMLAALRDAGIGAAELKQAISYLNTVAEATEVGEKISGRMIDDDISAALDAIERIELHSVIRLLRQLRRELPTGRAAANTVVMEANAEVKVNGKKERQARVSVSWLKGASISAETSVLLLDGTGSAPLNRRIFGTNLQHVHIPVERQAHVTGTIGKSYSRQSITGLDRNGIPRMPKNISEAAALRRDIGTIAGRMTGPVFIAATLQAETALVPSMPIDVLTGHFGAVRGLNLWERCYTGMVIGREQVSPHALEEIARPYAADDREPFISFGFYAKQTRRRRMRDGSVQLVEVDVHPHPLCQEMNEQLRESEIVQTADRVRPIFNERRLMLLNDLVVDATYDAILTHRELVSGGNRFDAAWRATGILPLGKKLLHRLHPGIWPNVKAADNDLCRSGRKGLILQIESYLGNEALSETPFRLEGQRGSDAAALIDPHRHPDPKAALEAAFGCSVTLVDPDPHPDPRPKAAPALQAAAPPPYEPGSDLDADLEPPDPDDPCPVTLGSVVATCGTAIPSVEITPPLPPLPPRPKPTPHRRL